MPNFRVLVQDNTFKRGIHTMLLQRQEALEMDASEPSQMLGTPVYDALELEGQTGRMKLETAVLVCSQSRNIVTTALQGRDGTVKEYISDGDYQISVDALLLGQNGYRFPESEVRTLVSLLKEKASLKVYSQFLQFFGVQDVVVEGYNVGQVRGSRSTVPIQMNLLSDRPIELRLNDNVTNL